MKDQVNKWTPGPWRVLPEECDRAYIRIRGDCPGTRYKIANVLTPVYDGVSEREAKETRANAHLIRTAPELYDALEEALQSLEYVQNAHPEATGIAKRVEDIARGRAVLAKARGAQ